jgi:hypothetical protein
MPTSQGAKFSAILNIQQNSDFKYQLRLIKNPEAKSVPKLEVENMPSLPALRCLLQD